MKDYDTEDIKFEFGKILGSLENTQTQLKELKEITNNGFKTVIEECNKNIRIHKDTCPYADQLNTHLIQHTEKEKYEKLTDVDKEKRINWFKWICSIVLGLLGIKGFLDIIFHGGNKVVNNLDKLTK